MNAPRLEVLADSAALSQRAAEVVRQSVDEAASSRGRATLALAGGSTPRELYHLLAAGPALPWERVHFFFGDERHVPPDDPASNYRMAREALFEVAPIPAQNIHRVRAELPRASDAAEQYEQQLRAFFGAADGAPARLDLILLGLGTDGHTASLFPGAPAIHEQTRWVMAQPPEKGGVARITFTPVLLNAAREVAFVVCGAEKAEALRGVLSGEQSVDELPARVVRPAGGPRWLVDRSAAALLNR